MSPLQMLGMIIIILQKNKKTKRYCMLIDKKKCSLLTICTLALGVDLCVCGGGGGNQFALSFVVRTFIYVRYTVTCYPVTTRFS